jgi:hypothetical protein
MRLADILYQPPNTDVPFWRWLTCYSHPAIRYRQDPSASTCALAAQGTSRGAGAGTLAGSNRVKPQLSQHPSPALSSWAAFCCLGLAALVSMCMTRPRRVLMAAPPGFGRGPPWGARLVGYIKSYGIRAPLARAEAIFAVP